MSYTFNDSPIVFVGNKSLDVCIRLLKRQTEKSRLLAELKNRRIGVNKSGRRRLKEEVAKDRLRKRDKRREMITDNL